MALIKCPECGTEVSDKAEKCPKCAYPINTQIKDKVQTIELTSKKYKGQLVLSVLLLSLGLFISLAAAGLAATGGGGTTLQALLAFIGIPLMVVGLIWYIITKIRIWWHHE